MTILARVLLLLMFSASAAAAQALPTVSIIDSDPALSASLGNNEQLYLRLAYRSDQPVHFHVDGLSDGTAVRGMDGGSPVHPAGAGEAVAWIAYPAGSSIDTLRISLLDKAWHEITSVRVPVQLRWEAGVARSRDQRPDWVIRWREAQAQAQTEPQQPLQNAGGVDWIGDMIVYGVPFYLVLQMLLGWFWSGGWRIAALIPLAVVGPAILWSLFALAAGSNIWPIMALLLTPFGLAYLAIVLAARGVAAIARA